MNAPDWMDLLQEAIKSDPRRISGVAEKMDISRPYVSRVIGGDIDPVPQKFIDRVLAIYARIDCPHLAQNISADECQRFASRNYSAINAADVPHWRACRRCPHKPDSKGSEA